MVTDPTEAIAEWFEVHVEPKHPEAHAPGLADYMRSRGWRFVRSECLDYLVQLAVENGEENGVHAS